MSLFNPWPSDLDLDETEITLLRCDVDELAEKVESLTNKVKELEEIIERLVNTQNSIPGDVIKIVKPAIQRILQNRITFSRMSYLCNEHRIKAVYDFL